MEKWQSDWARSWSEQERRARREWWAENLTIIGMYVAVVAIVSIVFIKMSS